VTVTAPPAAETDVFARLHAVVDEIVALDPDAQSDEAVAAGMLALRREMDRQEGAFARWALTGHQRGVGSRDGAARPRPPPRPADAAPRHRPVPQPGPRRRHRACGP
jgi:hypothetical protein